MNKIFKEAYSTLASLKKNSQNAKDFSAFTSNIKESQNATLHVIFKQGLIQPKTTKKLRCLWEPWSTIPYTKS